MYTFFGKIGSSIINEFQNLSFGSHCSANFQPILDCFIPKFKLKYDDLENLKIDCVNTVVFNLHQIKQSFFLGHPVDRNFSFLMCSGFFVGNTALFSATSS